MSDEQSISQYTSTASPADPLLEDAEPLLDDALPLLVDADASVLGGDAEAAPSTCGLSVPAHDIFVGGVAGATY